MKENILDLLLKRGSLPCGMSRCSICSFIIALGMFWVASPLHAQVITTVDDFSQFQSSNSTVVIATGTRTTFSTSGVSGAIFGNQFSASSLVASPLAGLQYNYAAAQDFINLDMVVGLGSLAGSNLQLSLILTDLFSNSQSVTLPISTTFTSASFNLSAVNFPAVDLSAIKNFTLTFSSPSTGSFTMDSTHIELDSPVEVPEPTSMMMFWLGLGLLGVLRARKFVFNLVG